MLVSIANDRAIADTTISVPHPYTLEYAQSWITCCNQEWEKNHSATFALELLTEKKLIGMNALRHIDREHAQAEIACWVGKDWWNQGFASEAGEAMIRFGFETLQLNRIYAYYMTRNPASGKVLTRIGMREEGILRQRVRKWGVFEDVAVLAILREDWRA
jgi:RimJ/RimL family protein N-acetyltransferase